MSTLTKKRTASFNFNRDKYSGLYGFQAAEVDLPFVEYDVETGEKLLIVLAFAAHEDVQNKKLGHSLQGGFAQALVEKINTEILTGRRDSLPYIKEVALINFRDKFGEKTADFGVDITADDFKKYCERLLDYIEAYKPTRILISGEVTYKALLYHTQGQTDLTALEYKEPFLQVGRVFPFDYRGVKIATTFTLPFHWTSSTNPIYVETAPHLMHQQKFHLEGLLHGDNRYTVTGKSTWSSTNLMTIEAFDEFYLKLCANKITCIDIETMNLARYANKVLTIHFSLDGYHAYNLPLCHRDTPFSADEILYIQNKLKDYFENGKSEYLIFHNAKFDLSTMVAQFGIRFINHKIFDTVAGIFLLDENVRLYTALQVPTYNLRHLAFQYGCAAYEEGEVRKEDRANMNAIALEHIFEYAAKDVIIPYQVSQFQLQEAERRGYKLWKEFILEQLGAMTLVFVGMETKGILVDKQYLIGLCGDDGFVRKSLDEILDEFKRSDAAKKVNEILVVQDRLVEALKTYKNFFRKQKKLLTVLKTEGERAEPKIDRSMKKAVKENTQLFENLTKKHLAKKQQIETNLPIILKDYESVILFLSETEKEMDKGVRLMKSYKQKIQEGGIIAKLESIRVAVLSIDDETIQPIAEKIVEFSKQMQDLTYIRSLPVDHNIEWKFDVAKQDAQQLLFFDVLGLKPIEMRKTGGGKADKEFQAAYQHIAEVALYDKFTKYKKLLGTYIEGMLKRLEEDPDSQLDGRLRADYGYKDVLTGRSSSKNPNFQNLVGGKFGKLIRRQFISERGCIYIKNDFNAAEVRQWANVSKDAKLASTFRAGMVMRKELFLEEDPVKRDELKIRIKGEGDVHRLNYSFFFNKDPKLVTDDERTAVKAVIFGVIYGKGSYTLAEDLKCSEAEAEALLNKLFTTYSNGGNWIKETQKNTRESLIATSPIGRVRHLGAFLHQHHTVKTSTDRKICNSVIQGFSSDMGYAGGRILQSLIYLLFQKHSYPLVLYQNNTVHDSVEAVTKFEHLPIALYLVDHAFTTLVLEKYRKVFGMEWVIESEMDSEIGCSIGHTKKLEWQNMPEQVREELDWSSTELGFNYSEQEREEILQKFEHNFKIMTKIKQYEAKAYLDFVKNNPQGVYLDCILNQPERFKKLRSQLVF